MTIKLGKRRYPVHFSRITLYTFILLLLSFTSLPLVYVVCQAFKPLEELSIYPPQFFVRNPTLTNFSTLVGAVSSSDIPFFRYVLNSLYVTVLSVFLSVFVCSLAAYGINKLRPTGHVFLNKLIIAALMFSGSVTTIPTYMVVQNLGLIDTYAALIIPKIAVSFNLFLMIQFMSQTPNSLLEAARIDGAREFKVFWNIVMPNVKPAWGTLIVFSFVSSWNDYFAPLVYTSKAAMKTLPLAIQQISGGAGSVSLTRAGAASAATLIMTAPTIIIYTVMQGKVIKTMEYSGIKE
ncbi:MAG: carbohydrate ABC transporter permease [Clostridia bacterium]|nr:carbohydrate ABC transporter permease [Clostridia bacterium]